MRFEEVVGLFADVEAGELTSWVERGWVQPDLSGEMSEFREIDVARVRLIRDLRHEMAVGEEAVGLWAAERDRVKFKQTVSHDSYLFGRLRGEKETSFTSLR